MRRRPRKKKDKYIIQLNNELKGTIVKKKKIEKKNYDLGIGRLCAQVAD